MGSRLQREGAQWNVTGVSKRDPPGRRTRVWVAQPCGSQATVCGARWHLAPGCLRPAPNTVWQLGLPGCPGWLQRNLPEPPITPSLPIAYSFPGAWNAI